MDSENYCTSLDSLSTRVSSTTLHGFAAAPSVRGSRSGHNPRTDELRVGGAVLVSLKWPIRARCAMNSCKKFMKDRPACVT